MVVVGHLIRLCIGTDGSFLQLLSVEDTIHVRMHIGIFEIVTVMDVMVDNHQRI